MSDLGRITKTLAAASVDHNPGAGVYLSGKQGIYSILFDGRDADNNLAQAAAARRALKTLATTTPRVTLDGPRRVRLDFVLADLS